MKRVAPCVLTAALLIVAASHAAEDAAGALELRVVAEMEVETVNDRGEPEVARIEAARIVPGNEVIYTISCANLGSEVAENVLITNPIPEHMLYVPHTAETNGASVLFSVDGGDTYGAPEDLVVDDGDDGVRRAGESDYTHIRWTLDEPLPPDAVTDVAFRAVLE